MGKLVGIYVAQDKELPLVAQESVRALAGVGLEGDRYATGKGTFWKADRPDRQLTLIESEAIVAASRDYQTPLDPAALRRNLVTEGVPLNHLVGRRFKVGEVLLEGAGLCEPCKHLDRLTGVDAQKPFRHRGGLRALVLESGVLRVGDAVVTL